MKHKCCNLAANFMHFCWKIRIKNGIYSF